MRTGIEVFDERSKRRGLATLEELGDRANGDDFAARGLPMVMACTGCTMTMNLFSCNLFIDGDGYVWCRECAGEDHDA